MLYFVKIAANAMDPQRLASQRLNPRAGTRSMLMLNTARRACVSILLATLFGACGNSTPGSFTSPGPGPDGVASATLTASEVRTVVQTAAQAVDSAIVIAVTDRQGNILAVFRKTGSPLTATGNFGQPVDAQELAVALARTASFFSNNQAPLSSRTVRFISGIHFPPGVSFTPNAALYGIENTNRGCPFNTNFLPGKVITPARSIDGHSTGLGIITGKADLFDSDPNAVNPGGVPLFKQGQLVGGVGVGGAPPSVAEYAAFAGATCSAATCGTQFGPNPAPPGVIVVDGVALPFVNQQTLPLGSNPGTLSGEYVMGPLDSPGPVPDGDLIAPSTGLAGSLTQQDVQSILDAAAATAAKTRAVIRLPLGSRARMVIAVTDLDGTLIGLRRMPDATVFSIDVAVAKARNVIYFSSQRRQAAELPDVPMGTAVTNRTISFGAQPFFPPGIDGTQLGPFFRLFQLDTANACTQGFQPANRNQNGIVFFPGSEPLYKNGVLVGGLGVSGDGVDQDDFVTAGGAAGFEAPMSIRADQIMVRSVRMPYLKFPRNPTD